MTYGEYMTFLLPLSYFYPQSQAPSSSEYPAAILGGKVHENFQCLADSIAIHNEKINLGSSKKTLKRILETPCAICLDDMDQKGLSEQKEKTAENVHQLGARILETPCAHYFHEKCVGEWLENQLTCPLCRSPVFSMNKDQSEVFITAAKAGDYERVKMLSQLATFNQKTYSLALLYALKGNHFEAFKYLFLLNKVDSPTKYLATYIASHLKYGKIKDFLEAEGFTLSQTMAYFFLSSLAIFSCQIPYMSPYVSTVSSLYCLSWYARFFSQLNQVFYTHSF